MNEYSELFNAGMNETREYYPLSQSQMGIYLSCMSDPSTDMYNIPFCCAFDKSAIDAERLTAAIKGALSNHAALCCRVEDKNGEPVMIPGEPSFDVPVIVTAEAELPAKLDELERSVSLKDNVLVRAVVFETEKQYRAAFVFHHIVFDGSSFGVLSGEIERLYNGGTIESEPVSTLKLGVFEEKLESAGGFDEGREFFRKRFEGSDVRTELIPDVNVDGAERRNRSVSVFSDSGLVSEVEAFNGGKGVGMFFIAAFAYALSKFTGQSETVFCTVNHGRSTEALKSAVGMLVRTLPIYTKHDEEMTVKDYIASVKSEVKDTIVSGNYPFTKLASEYGLTMGISFVYQGDRFNRISLGGTEAEMELLTPRDALSPIDFHVWKEEGGYKIQVFYRSDMYTEEYIRSFAEMYLNIVSELTKREYLRDISLVSEKETARLDSFNNTEADYDRGKTVIDLFREQAENYPDNAAVVFRDKRFTYRQVDEISERIAGHLSSLGIGSEDVVAILIPRCEYMALASLGALKAGAGYQPLDPTYPPERLSFMVKDSGAKLLIADESLVSLIPDYSGKVLLTKDIPALPDCPKLTTAPKPENLFIMLYTSGSTGIPKGVMLEHGNLAAFCNWYRKYYTLTAQSRVAAYASYGFDACMMDLYPALTTGACVYIIDEAIRLDLGAMNEYFEENGVTHSFMTTQVGRMFAETMENRTLKHLSTGGEALVPVAPPEYNFYNVYGPTECTIYTTAFRVDKTYNKIPIGKPLDNMKLYITDKQGRRLPAGACGELCVTGYQVGRGYLNRPELTAFTKNPFSDKAGYERMYRTGDVVRFLPDGNIDFVGRNDGQVKVRGFRIELSEVESVIREFRGIKDAAVVAKDAAGGGKYVAAYIVSDEEVNIDELNKFIAENKPPYMVPAATMQIEKIPLNVNGKVDKRKLPEIEMKAAEIVAPKTETQKKILGIAAKLIGSESFGVTTDLFSAGLTSISVIKLTALLSKEFGVSVTFADVKANETVEKLEKIIHSADGEETFEMLAEYPITKTQQGIFAECMKNAGTTIYNIPYLLKLGANVNAERLKEAVAAALNAHPYIKTILKLNDEGEVRAVRRDGEEASVSVVKCSALPEADELVRPFELLGQPLYRAAVYDADDGLYLYLDLHHIVSDGESEMIILSDIDRAYAGETLETEEFTGYEAALAEQKKLSGGGFEKAKKYYDSVFAGCDTDFLPVPDKREEQPSVDTIRRAADIDLDGLKRFLEANGVSANAFFNSVLGFVTAEYNYSDNAVFAAIYNGRNDPRLEKCVTMLVKTLPVLCDISGDKTVAGFVKETQSQLMDSMANDIYSFAEVSANYGITADILFAYQGDNFNFDTLCGEPCGQIPLALNAAKAPLSLDVAADRGKLVWTCEYRADMYGANTVETLLDCLAKVSGEFLAKEKLNDVELTDDKQEELLKKFNATDAPLEDITANRLFERQAELYPERAAVVTVNETVTYKQLNENANRIANLLIKEITPDSFVGVMLPRKTYVYAARQGILKAGGAFMHVAPDYPDDRVEYIFADSKAKFVVTTSALASERAALFAKCGVTALSIEKLLEGGNTENPSPAITPQNLAYCIYTSGSTGKPKGVMIEHHSLVNSVSPENQFIGNFCREQDVFVARAALTFDVSVEEETVPLYHGKTIALADEDEMKDPVKLARLIDVCKVDMISCTPTFIEALLECPEAAAVLPRMSSFDIGAEAFPTSLYERLRAAGINGTIYNSYGPTEATITATSAIMVNGKVTIGKPLANYRNYIIDKRGRSVPVGARGELLICGEGVGRGYVGNEKLTAEKFIRWRGMPAYKSGDLARYNFDGDIEFFGRLDNQVKLRGLRIELDEIENVMNTFGSIKASVVTVINAGQPDAFLCGYFTAEGGADIDVKELAAHLKKSLAVYMVPPVFMQLPEFPMNANGKIDRRALPRPEKAERPEGKAPANDTERFLCGVFAEILGMEKIYADDNFFELGGTSLTVTRIVAAAGKKQYNLAFGDVFSHPTPSELAAFVGGGAPAQPEFDDLSDYDYSRIDALLKKNTLKAFKAGKRRPLGNILLTGSTGFLGVHVLSELLNNCDNKIYCLVRSREKQTAEHRLDMVFFYYFDTSIVEKWKDRFEIVEGDITDNSLSEKLAGIKIDTVINCAANVKHFSKGNDIERVNYLGVKNLIAWCKTSGAGLIQISTVSVGGVTTSEEPPLLSENMLFCGQKQISKYTQSKYLAERDVLEAAADGMFAKVIRVGNLCARDSDGEFQMNFSTNSFMGQLKSIVLIGGYPYENMGVPVELSPIDSTARSILLLSETPAECVLFHAYNNNVSIMETLYEQIRGAGMEIKPVENDVYSEMVERTLRDPKKAETLTGMIAYENMGHGQVITTIEPVNRYTMQVLYRMGFSWPVASDNYIRKFVNALKTLCFFDTDL